MFRADLHTHSTCSDGSYSPSELLHHAKSLGLSGLSITDHDSVAAYTESLFQEAKSLGVLLGTGVELSCELDGVSIHVLGYGFTPSHSDMVAFCNKHQERRKARFLAILEKLQKKKVFLEKDFFVEGSYSVGRPHIAKQMMKQGYVKSMQEAFHHFLGEDKSCYVKGDAFTIEETISLLHRCGGKAFLAHPHLLTSKKIIKKVLDMPFDGIECYYAKCTRDREMRWIQLAKERNLLISGGSDFHGVFKPNIPLGCSWVEEEYFYQIFSSQASLVS